MKKLLFSILIVFAWTAGFGVFASGNIEPDPNPKGGEIKGYVKDGNASVPMEYASIAVYNLSDSSLVTGTVSNDQGYFILDKIPYGSYYIEVQFIGYDKQVLGPFELGSGNRSLNVGEVDLLLNTKNIEEVEVVAQQKRVEYRIDKKVVNVGEDLSAAGGTAVDVLENTPSIEVDIEGNVTMRGSGSFKVLINGKPTVLEGGDALRTIPASSIQNIEIITNPSVKYDPDGNAGIINVIMKKQSEKGLNGIVNASVGINQKYSLDALINRRVGRANYFIGGNYSKNTFLGNLEREHITFGDTLHYNVADGNFDFLRGGGQLKAGMDYDITPNTNLSVEGSGGSSSFGIDRTNNSHEYTLPGSIDNYYVNTDVMSRNNLYYSGNISLTHNFDSSDHKIVAMANFSRGQSDELEDLKFYDADPDFNVLTGGVAEESRNVETGDDVEYRYQVDYSRPLGRGALDAGYQGRIENDLGDFQFQQFDPDTDQWMTLGDNSSDISFYRNIQGAYAQYGGSIKKIQYQLGIRGEYTYRLIEYENFNTSYEINRFDYYPTIHFSRQLENDQQLMLSYSKRVNRPRSYHLDSIPSFVDKQTIRIGNPGLEPEYVNSFEIGYQKGWGRNFLAVEGFYRNTTNIMSRVTEYDDVAGIFYMRMMNLNEDHSLGSEVMVNWQFAQWLTVNASTSGFYYRIQGELFGETIDNSNFRWKANTNTTINYSKTGRIQLSVGYYGPSVSAQGSNSSMFFTNLAIRQDFMKRKLSATLQVRDLLGTMKRDMTSSGPGFEQHIVMQHEPRVVMFTLSYKINNYRPDPQSQRGQDGGMEMDAGF